MFEIDLQGELITLQKELITLQKATDSKVGCLRACLLPERV